MRVKKWSEIGAKRLTVGHSSHTKDFVRYIMELERARSMVNTIAKTDNYEIYQGDSMALMVQLDDNSVDYIVTDPPYASG